MKSGIWSGPANRALNNFHDRRWQMPGSLVSELRQLDGDADSSGANKLNVSRMFWCLSRQGQPEGPR